MRVGIANPFAYRPHVAHMAFIHRQLQRLGHQTFFLGCRGALDNCASRVTKTGLAKKMECFKCRAGSIRSYLDVQPGRIDATVEIPEDVLGLGKRWSYSTASTTLQVEREAEASGADFEAVQNSLSASTARAYLNARHWIRENALDTVFIFNGRYDLTRAILEACRAQAVRFVSVERSWFGDGLQLLPQENCLGLRTFHDLCARWAQKPLKHEQAVRASGLIGARLARTSRGEWRQYNLASGANYHRDEIKYLYLPSSQHEWLGEPDRSCEWAHPVDALEYLFERVGLDMKDLVVRAHPGWAMKIKNYGSNRAAGFYRDWCRRTGAEYIEPSASIDTHALMRRSKMVLLNASSASLEAAWLGKPVVSFAPAAFTSSGISMNIFAKSDVDGLSEQAKQLLVDPAGHPLDSLRRCQLALRFIYCANFRIMQFVDSMRSISPFAFGFVDPQDLSGLQSLVTGGTLQEDDVSHAQDDTEERQIAMAIINGEGDAIGVAPREQVPDSHLPMRRRMGYRLIDRLFG
jgi:hypothetical protein